MKEKTNQKSRTKVETNQDGFTICPRCGANIGLKLYPDDALEDYPLWCSSCRRTSHVDRAAASIIDATCAMMERLNPHSRRLVYDMVKVLIKGQEVTV